jgi:hypothetical protein
VAVGVDGTLVVSADAKTFAAEPSGSDKSLSSIVYGKNIFVVVGQGGVILTSQTGLGFKPQYSPTDVDLAHVIFTGERFVAVGGDYNVGSVTLVSADGLTWKQLSSPGTHIFRALAHRGVVLIAAAHLRSDLGTPALFTALPGQDWQEGVGPDFNDSVSYEDEVYVIDGSNVHHFVDGAGWTGSALPAGKIAHTITHSDSMFVAAGEQGAIVSSADGATWTDHSIAGETGYWSGVCYGGTKFVAVGSGGRIVSSSDGAEWTTSASGTTKTLLDVAFTPGETP